MEVFGQALLDFSRGDNEKFYLQDSRGKRSEQRLSKYFRNYKEFTKLEREIISLSRGEILDVGCGTGQYVSYLMKKGNVLGIDISSKAIQVAKEKYKLRNVKVADIFNFKSTKKFDTIVLLENNLGMAQTIPRTKKLLKILLNHLKTNGKILTDAHEVDGKNHDTVFNGELRPVWKNKIGDKFIWINFNSGYLKKLCEEMGLNLKVIGRNNTSYLAKITKK